MPSEGRADLGIGALELFVEVLSQSEAGVTVDGFYDHLCEAVCRLARMRRALIFRYDSRRPARAGGRARMAWTSSSSRARTSPSSRPRSPRRPSARIGSSRSSAISAAKCPRSSPRSYPSPRGWCARRWPRRTARSASSSPTASWTRPPLDDADRRLLWTLGKAAALAAAARIVSTQFEKASQLEQRIDLARELHEGVIQRLFGVSMALDGDGELPASARRRCAEETQAALTDLRAALQRPLGRAPRATRTTLVAEVKRLAVAHPHLGLSLVEGTTGDVPPLLEPLAQSVLIEAVRNAGKHAKPTHVDVRLGRANGAFSMDVVNDGVSSHPPPARHGPASGGAGGTAVKRRRRVRRARARARGRCGWWCPTRTMTDEERSPERLRVLVVDDHDVVHWGFRLMLTQQSWVERCVSAHTGPEAVTMTKRYRPHVALVDLFIGEESGAEVCERVREAEPTTRVLLFSGAGEISPQAARAAGASGFAYKDWPARKIASAVRLVGHRQDRVRAPGPPGRARACPTASVRCST